MTKYAVTLDSTQPLGSRLNDKADEEIAYLNGKRLRTGTYSFELGKGHASSWANQPFNNSREFAISVDATRFRVHWRNWDQLAGVDSGAVTELQFYIGVPEVDGDGNWSGQYTVTPTLIEGPTSVPSGTEHITPWVDASDFAIEANKHYVLNQGLKASATGALAFSGEPNWQGYTSNGGAIAAPTVERADNATFGWAWIEFEYVDETTNIFLIGNSLSNGSQAASPNNGQMTAAINRWALRNKGIVTSIAAAGTWAGHYNVDGPRWHLYDSCETPLDPDVVYYPALNSSDLVGASLAIAKTNILAVLALGKAKFPNARHILTNVPARSEISDDTDRLALNAWMHLLTWNPDVADVLDLDTPITDWASPARQRAPLTAEGIHLSPQGHEVWSQWIDF